MTKIITPTKVIQVSQAVNLTLTMVNKPNCCGDCKGQGSCHKVTAVSMIPKMQSEIAPIKK
ncbi:MAG: hypothetical protein PSX81_02930 [bacterium]|nr:hypothetical protein [bacterium]